MNRVKSTCNFFVHVTSWKGTMQPLYIRALNSSVKLAISSIETHKYWVGMLTELQYLRKVKEHEGSCLSLS